MQSKKIAYRVLYCPAYCLLPIGWCLLATPYCMLLASFECCSLPYVGLARDHLLLESADACSQLEDLLHLALSGTKYISTKAKKNGVGTHQDIIQSPRRLYKAPTDYTKTQYIGQMLTKNVNKHEKLVFLCKEACLNKKTKVLPKRRK